MAGDDGGSGVRILVVPEDGRDSRTFRLTGGTVRLLVGALATLAILAIGVAGSWWFLAARAAMADRLQVRVALLEGQESRIEALASRLRRAEERYDRLRGLFGTDTARLPPSVWLPPLGGSGAGGTGADGGDPSIPRSWPLTTRGFITQPLHAGDAGDHQGVDIAVPGDSYVRAAGAGAVRDVGTDPVYGNFVVLEHGDGYRTLYAHASQTLVEAGQPVRRNEVIALSGTTGRSTAPHLHFEILHDGEAVDPLEFVRQP